jgi:peptidoglycan-N-acetylglucosamine deacetylase
VNWFTVCLAIIAGGLAIFPGVYIVIPAIITKFLKRKCNRRSTGTKQIWFTFDDGPDKESTPRIMDLLENHGIQGIFFLIGNRIEENIGIVEDILWRGHRVGLHGYGHLHPWRCSPIRMLKDLRKEDEIFKKYLGKDAPKIYRPPYGKFNILSMLYCIISKREICLWSIDPRDYANDDPIWIAKHIVAQGKNGGIILMHDGRFGISANKSEVTVSAMAYAIGEIVTENKNFPAVPGNIDSVPVFRMGIPVESKGTNDSTYEIPSRPTVQQEQGVV